MLETSQEIKRSIVSAPENQVRLAKAVETLQNKDAAARTKTAAKNLIEKQIGYAFSFHGNNVQFDMFALPHLYRDVREDVMAG